MVFASCWTNGGSSCLDSQRHERPREHRPEYYRTGPSVHRYSPHRIFKPPLRATSNNADFTALATPALLHTPIGWPRTSVPAPDIASSSPLSRDRDTSPWSLIRPARACRRAVLSTTRPCDYPQPANRPRRTTHQSDQYGLYGHLDALYWRQWLIESP